MKRIDLAVLSILLAACVHTQEMPLAPNMVRIDTNASGLLFAGQAAPTTMHRAAELTLKAGYTHFKFEQANISQGSEVTGTTSIGNASKYGGNVFASSSSTLERRHVEDVGVTVIMFHAIMFLANEPGARNAFDAAKVLQQQSG